MNSTVVTGIMDIGRGRISDSPWARPFSYYTSSLFRLMAQPRPMVLYVQRRMENLVYALRRHSPTEIVIVEPEELRLQFPYYDLVQEILHSESWLRQTPRMKSSVQYLLDDYLPFNMMKSYWLKEVAEADPHHTDGHFWIDGGVCSNRRFPQLGDFSVSRIFNSNAFVLCCMPCIVRREMHGFPREKMERYAGVRTMYFRALGGILGGRRECVLRVFALYEAMLQRTLLDGCLGTEENIYTILMNGLSGLFDVYHPVLKQTVLDQKWVARESRIFGLFDALGVIGLYRRLAPSMWNYDER
jgi:hypothetical protein